MTPSPHSPPRTEPIPLGFLHWRLQAPCPGGWPVPVKQGRRLHWPWHTVAAWLFWAEACPSQSQGLHLFVSDPEGKAVTWLLSLSHD